MTNNFLNMLNPQMQNNLNLIHQKAIQSGNPQQYLLQQYGNDPYFKEGFEILNKSGIEGLNEYLRKIINR